MPKRIIGEWVAEGNTWVLDIGPLWITLTHYINYPSEEWVLFCAQLPSIDFMPLDNNLEKAKLKAEYELRGTICAYFQALGFLPHREEPS